MAFTILYVCQYIPAKPTCVDNVSKLFSFLTLRTLFVMINEFPNPWLMRNIFSYQMLNPLLNPLSLSIVKLYTFHQWHFIKDSNQIYRLNVILCYRLHVMVLLTYIQMLLTHDVAHKKQCVYLKLK